MSTDSSTAQPQGEGKYILSVAPDGSVIQFNPDCERLTGYSRAEVLNKGFAQLIPPGSQAEWDALFADMKTSLHDASFDLPVQTRSQTQVMVSWNTFLVKDPNAGLQSICLLGEAKETTPVSPPVAQQSVPEPSPVQPVSLPTSTVSPEPSPEYYTAINETKASMDALHADLRSIQGALASMNTLLEGVLKTMQSSQTALNQLPAELQTITEGIQELRTRTQPERAPRKQPVEEPSPHVHFGLHKKAKTAQEAGIIQQQSMELESREQQLREKERELNLRLDDFCIWKEKLKAVEEDIERRQAVLAASPPSSPPVAREPDHSDAQTLEYLSALPDGAVIVQRGIIKQVNEPFAALVGYDVQNLVEKSLFDFVALEGLGRIEQYYLDRLKGESLPGYSTVFLKKDQTTIPADVQIKTIRCNGETAEVLLVNPSSIL